MHGSLNTDTEVENLIGSLRSGHRASHIYMVSNEVGMGIVPDNELARRFRDLAGILNRRIAEVSDKVYLITAGITLKIK
jgi:adenosylcobinamide kinase/adenosylcobinamide-phosphate guanylyltransferase